MKKLFNIINLSIAASLPLLSLNIIMSKANPNYFFSLIFICLAFCDTLLGINLLNANKKILSVSSFILAGFLFVLVGCKIFLYN